MPGPRLLFVAGCAALGLFALAHPAAATTQPVLTGSALAQGFDAGVNSSSGKTGWLEREATDLKLSYPAGEMWGAVFITVGPPREPPRPARDFSAFDVLTVEMRGAAAGQELSIGLKTKDQPDDGTETKRSVALTVGWKTYEFPLQEFTGTDPRKLYVVAEFVFSGPRGQTVYVRNVRYSDTHAAPQRQESRATPDSTPRVPAPEIAITYPPDGASIPIPRGKAPSISAQGTVGSMPAGWGLYLVVHPTNNDNVWASAVAIHGEQWTGQAYLGGPEGRPRHGDVFEVFVALSDHPLPATFNLNDVTLQRRSVPVRVTMKESDPPGLRRRLAGFIPIVVALLGLLGIWIGKARRSTPPRKPAAKR